MINNKFPRYVLWAALWLLSLGLLPTAGVLADDPNLPERTLNNPHPLADDLILSMPEGREMVLRMVPVPGTDFWGGPERVVQLGDAGGSVFEGLQRTQINGSFQHEDGRWYIVLAKYELTKDQFIAVMGMDWLLWASGDSRDREIPGLREGSRQWRQMRQEPLAFVSHQAMTAFIHRYNQWLFDPEHPERLEALPRFNGVPGFLRLPTEEEWEFAAREGMLALAEGRFEQRLPFSLQRINEYAWHQGNSENAIREVGMRQPNALGIHDLFGNVQEMTVSLFRPEIGQGKPGGVAVRGGHVLTPAQDMRSSLRSEMEIYQWDRDQQQMREMRNYVTGARLAVGSNVVISSEYYQQINEEYERYQAGLRQQTPVGTTLDNRVAQASGQLSAGDLLLQQLLEEYQELNDPLINLRDYLDRAREQLEWAQRENARSLAQDALRNGANLSHYLTRQAALEQSRVTVQRLVEISVRYQSQLEQLEARLAEFATGIDDQLLGYQDKITQLGEYQTEYIAWAMEELQGRGLPEREQQVLAILQEHITEFHEQRRPNPEAWLGRYQEAFVASPD